MAAETRVQQLLDEISDSGRTPEEVCGACTELLPEVRRCWRQTRILEAELDVLFPTLRPDPDADTPVPWPAGAALPRFTGYDVEALLGRGGMAVAHKARHLRLNRLVALKMLVAGAYAGPNERARFRREAEAMAGLLHLNTVQVYDVGDHQRWPYWTSLVSSFAANRCSRACPHEPRCKPAHLEKLLRQRLPGGLTRQ